jgi:hypothetical protein
MASCVFSGSFKGKRLLCEDAKRETRRSGAKVARSGSCADVEQVKGPVERSTAVLWSLAARAANEKSELARFPLSPLLLLVLLSCLRQTRSDRLSALSPSSHTDVHRIGEGTVLHCPFPCPISLLRSSFSCRSMNPPEQRVNPLGALARRQLRQLEQEDNAEAKTSWLRRFRRLRTSQAVKVRRKGRNRSPVGQSPPPDVD